MQRDRPLQNSMFLPDPNPNRRIPMEYSNGNPNVLKKNLSGNYGMNATDGYFTPTNTSNNQFKSARTYQGEEQKQSGGTRNIEQMFSDFSEKFEKLSRIVDRHEFQLSSQNFDNKKEELSKQVLNQIKQALPVITGTNDVYEHIFGLKLDIKNLKQEISKMNEKVEAIPDEIQKVLSSNPPVKNDKTLPEGLGNKEQLFKDIKNQILNQRDQFFKRLIGSVETQVSIIKKTLNNYTMDLKVSPINSSSCIMLKYQQLFKARTKNEQDMVLSEQTYYIDNEGHLLDCHSRYLVDQKGKKVKLQDKHLSLLKLQKILQ